MTQLIPRSRDRITSPNLRLTLERLSGDRVQTGVIDVSGEEFKAWARTTRIDAAIESLASELARHLGVTRDDVNINEEAGREIRGVRRFRLIAYYLGKPKHATDGVAAWNHWRQSASSAPKQLPDYIDI